MAIHDTERAIELYNSALTADPKVRDHNMEIAKEKLGELKDKTPRAQAAKDYALSTMRHEKPETSDPNEILKDAKQRSKKQQIPTGPWQRIGRWEGSRAAYAKHSAISFSSITPIFMIRIVTAGNAAASAAKINTGMYSCGIALRKASYHSRQELEAENRAEIAPQSATV